MGLPVKVKDRSEWRTQHQPIVEVSEVVLENAGVAVAVTVDAVAGIAAVVVAVDAEERKRRNGSPSLS